VTAQAADSWISEDGSLKPTWYNDLRFSIFLPGCETITFEQVENDVVVWTGHPAVCAWEGTARVLGFTDLLGDLALKPEGRPGTYRVTGTSYEGCTWGKPISQAACSNKVSLTSNSIVVTE
jgi:hypothetical protein